MSVFATDVSGGETCDTDVLNTDTGPVNLRAEFEPETIDLRWYNNNTLLNVTSTNSNNCTYDAPINLPANPTKPGYKFKGWKVVPEYDISTIPTNTSVLHSCTNNPAGGCSSCNSWSDCDLNRYEWKVLYSGSGTVYGMALCSNTPDDSSVTWDIGNPNETQGSGNYCWCKATGFIPTGQTVKYKSTNTPWVALGPYTNCLSSCIVQCQPTVNQTYRAILFGKQSS